MMTEKEFVNQIRTAGARVFIVGGWVRDFLRQVPAHDKDYMVAGIDEEKFQQVFPKAPRVGKAFPVYLVEIDGHHAEVAFARKEEKQGAGYRGFVVEYGREVTLEEDLYRRDTTINSMAMELPSGEIFDFYGGRSDVEQGIIRPVSHHFAEDPVRALRAARQAAEFNFTLAEETKTAMNACREELAGEPAERLLQELKRALMTERPSVFFRALQETGLLAVTFPELAKLIGKTQPEAFHPEGDAFEHTMLVVDTVAAETDSLLARFCGLVHDLGKGETPAEMLPHHYGHEVRGQDVLRKWNQRMTLPKKWLQGGMLVIEQHMRAPRLTKAGKITELLLKVNSSPLTMAEFQAVIRADHHSLPFYLEQAPAILARMQQVNGNQAPNTLTGAAIGDWVRSQQVKAYQELKNRNQGDTEL